MDTVQRLEFERTRQGLPAPGQHRIEPRVKPGPGRIPLSPGARARLRRVSRARGAVSGLGLGIGGLDLLGGADRVVFVSGFGCGFGLVAKGIGGIGLGRDRVEMVGGARGGLSHMRGAAFRQRGFERQPRDLRQRAIERALAPRILTRRRLARPIEPREVGEQQPAVEPTPRRDQFAAEEHRLFHPFERALGQHRLGMCPREAQRRAPPGGKGGIAPPRQVGPRTRHPAARGGDPDIAVPGQLGQEEQLQRGGEDGIGPGKVLHRIDPPAPGDRVIGIVDVHGCGSCRKRANRPCCRFWGSRKIWKSF